MSTLRKTVLTTAIIGAGLASTAGSALAHDSHDGGHEKAKHESSGCSNSFVGETGNSKNAFSALNDSQGALGLNVCDVLSHNDLLNGNSVSVGGAPTLPPLPTDGLPG